MTPPKLSYFIATGAIVFIALGLAGGEYTVVWQKAVMICLECIGIG